MSPEWKSPVSDVTVWSKAPRFVQHTVVPGVTTTVAGLNAKSTMSAEADPAGHD
jgi:hypothetical protein